MKFTAKSILVLAAFILITAPKLLQAQSLEILGGNTLNGIVQGAIMGGASMGINNTDNLAYLRVGVGTGAFYGIGMGVFDLIQSRGSGMLVSGFFNDGNNSSIIVLLDTIYGAAAGTVVASAFMLVANKPLIEGLQYGSSVGAWVGFGFGLLDTFTMAERTSGGLASKSSSSNSANGLLALNFDNGASVGFLHPTIVHTKTQNLDNRYSAGVDFLSLKLSF